MHERRESITCKTAKLSDRIKGDTLRMLIRQALDNLDRGHLTNSNKMN